VDGANVVGARPDGWWRDRGAAARRLADGLARLAAAPGTTELPGQLVLVLEGAARAGVPAGAGADRGLIVVHAPGEGDDHIVEQARTRPDPVLVVTADRGLRARVEAAGASTAGPGWLWRLIDGAGDGPPPGPS
jgi:hypothetical protein